ncbi:MAG: hypothetical protein QOG35_1987 [Solirubrobacteraceae bacterium]|jgi:hypothetical protein|nr:hypothetical protein [Solirubrobacteraceae bacterium]
MARNRVAEPELAPAGVAFEVERFEWTAPDRLEVAGRWFGLRGHRFVRPVLIVHGGEDRRRLLALLEHKPWAVEDGEEWVAAFPWEGEPVRAASAELAVAPSLAVELGPPRAPGVRRDGGRTRPTPVRRQAPPRRAPREAPPPPSDAERLRVEHARELAARDEELAALRRHREDGERTAERLRAELERARERLAGAVSAVHERERLARERDAAIAQRDAAVAQRDAAHARPRPAPTSAPPPRAAPIAAPSGVVRPAPPSTRARDDSTWAPRLAALAVLAVLAIVVYALLHGAV